MRPKGTPDYELIAQAAGDLAEEAAEAARRDDAPGANAGAEAGLGDGATPPRATQFMPDPTLRDVSPNKQIDIIDSDSLNPGKVGGTRYPNSNNIRIGYSSIDPDPSGNGVF